MYTKITAFDGSVLIRRDADRATFPLGAETADHAAFAAWENEGNTPALEDLRAVDQTYYAVAIQAHIDATARSRGYADGVACASYITSTIPIWQAEAAAFVPWRDSVWLAAYSIMGQVQAGQRPAPSIADLISELPAITWPGA